MIRINLLPAEMRRGNRLAARVLIAAFASALAVSASIGWFGVVWFGQLAAAEQKLSQVEQKLGAKEQKAAYHDQLQNNKQDYAQRVQTIQDIGKSRRLWSKFLDELIDVVNNNGNTERHLAWLTKMTVRTDPKKGATIDIPAHVQDADKSRLANFHEDLEHAPFADEVTAKSVPTWQVKLTKERTPPQSLSFPLMLELAPRVTK